MLKYTLILIYAVGAAYSWYMTSAYLEYFYGLDNPAMREERFFNYTHKFDDVASNGLLNFKDLGRYGDTGDYPRTTRTTYTGFGKLNRSYNYLLLNPFFYVLFGADFRQSCRKSVGTVPSSRNSPQERAKYRLLWRCQRPVVRKQKSDGIDRV